MMDPGKDLDCEIARKVFRYVVMIDTDGTPQIRDRKTRTNQKVPPYSTDTNISHDVVSRLKKVGCTFNIKNDVEDGQIVWTAQIRHPKLAGLMISSKGKTLPHAICLATLQFVKLFDIGE